MGTACYGWLEQSQLAQASSPTAARRRCPGPQAPEVIDGHAATTKGDVFSFGVVRVGWLPGGACCHARPGPAR